MKALSDCWEFNVLGVYDYLSHGKLEIYYSWIIENHKRIEGDILEAGVYQGKSLLATALLLKQLGSDKKVYGFDSFSGFPPVYHTNDDLSMFEVMHKDHRIDDAHFDAHKKLIAYRSLIKDSVMTISTISSSTDFSDTSEELIRKKADYLGLDNLVLIKGDFLETMRMGRFPKLNLMAALLDCDLYSSYKIALPFIWERLSRGGYVYLDEYYSLKFPGARIACDEFFSLLFEKPLKAAQIQRDFERWYAIKAGGEFT